MVAKNLRCYLKGIVKAKTRFMDQIPHFKVSITSLSGGFVCHGIVVERTSTFGEYHYAFEQQGLEDLFNLLVFET